jgi:hypothetical protein
LLAEELLEWIIQEAAELEVLFLTQIFLFQVEQVIVYLLVVELQEILHLEVTLELMELIQL